MRKTEAIAEAALKKQEASHDLLTNRTGSSHLYGRVDTGLAYTSTDSDKAGTDAVNSFEMKSGFTTGNRWGIKGSEDLGNGMKVGFVLESGFESDDGTLGQGGRLFGRESTVSLAGDFGTVYMGRMNTLASDGGSMGLMGATSVIGNAMDILSMKGSTGSTYDRYDNLVGYVSPSFGGLTISAQYAMGANGQENKASTDRYGALGAQYAVGPMTLVGVAEYYVWGHDVGVEVDNGLAFQFGGNYDLGVVQPYAKVAYFKDMKTAKVLESNFWEATDYAKSTYVEGYGLELGAKTPVAGGTAFAAVSYRDTEDSKDSAIEFKRFSVGAGYTYPFSKRTNVYGALGYAQEKGEGIADERTPSRYVAGVGLVHKF